MYRGAPCDFQKLTTDSTSASLTNAPWMRVGLPASTGWYSMSPRPSSFSAPPESRMTRLSTCDPTANAMREGMLALMRPVMMSVDGRCVAMTRWMPTARASCAMRHISSSISPAATIIRSASSSITITMYGSCRADLSVAFSL